MRVGREGRGGVRSVERKTVNGAKRAEKKGQRRRNKTKTGKRAARRMESLHG